MPAATPPPASKTPSTKRPATTASQRKALGLLLGLPASLGAEEPSDAFFEVAGDLLMVRLSENVYAEGGVRWRF